MTQTEHFPHTWHNSFLGECLVSPCWLHPIRWNFYFRVGSSDGCTRVLWGGGIMISISFTMADSLNNGKYNRGRHQWRNPKVEKTRQYCYWDRSETNDFLNKKKCWPHRLIHAICNKAQNWRIHKWIVGASRVNGCLVLCTSGFLHWWHMAHYFTWEDNCLPEH